MDHLSCGEVLVCWVGQVRFLLGAWVVRLIRLFAL
jgi:hypothetical protein